MKNKIRNILVCVAGATPQVITETIYALSKKSPPVHVEELHVITTAHGKKLIKEKLLDDGILEQLLTEYKLPPIRFTEESIVVINDSEGRPLNDIRNDMDNEATGDIITGFIRAMADREDVALHCSIAGGRKTMSFYLGSALQLFGRPRDRLYHVLVTPEFENNPEFFYPPKKPKRIRCRMPDGTEKLISTRKAEVHLADLPFVLLRNRIYIEGKTFREMIDDAKDSIALAISHSPLKISLKNRCVSIENKIIYLQPVLLAFYTLLADRKKKYCSRKDRKHCEDCSGCYLYINDLAGMDMLKRIENIYVRIYGQSSRLENENWQKHREKKGISKEIIRQNFSKINSRIRECLADPDLYLISGQRVYGSTRYGLRVDKTRIEIDD
ncbi:MAG: TIGR02584 family CRISPR-associated protein [Nitrospirae bacterium]|nr:TIGR02584 family CRISPR-associated protein [Nitrospirota bacterium]